MEIKEIDDIKIWTDFFNQNGSPSFLQSWEWGEVQKSLEYNLIRVGLFKNSFLKAIAQIIKIRSKRGAFIFIPHGPIFAQIKNEKLKIKNLIDKLKSYLIKIAEKENFTFIRVAPILEDVPENKNIFLKLGFRTAPIYMHAETVWELPLFDLSKHQMITDDELLSQMRKTTRYSIRKAIRDGVVIEKRTDKKAVDDFYKIYQETAEREHFVPFSKDYINKEFEAFNETGNALFLFAKIKTNHLASALIIFTPSTVFYHQGASIHTKVPATYLLQWEAIREAKKRGCQYYNFWGIYNEETKRMPSAWKGLTLFKIGFGGKKVCYLPTQDYIISPKYYLSYIWEKLLSWKRGA